MEKWQEGAEKAHPDTHTALARATCGTEILSPARGAGTCQHSRPPSQAPLLTGAAVLLGKQVVSERRGVRQALHSGVKETCVPQVTQSRANSLHLLPLHGQALHGEEHLLGRRDPIPWALWGIAALCGMRNGG